jgi:predicted ATPase
MAVASQVLALADQSGDDELALLGHLELAIAEHWSAKYESAFGHYEAGRRLYEARRQQAPTSTVRGVGDFVPVGYLDLGVGALGLGAWSMALLGWPDRALDRVRAAVALAHDLHDPFSLAYALFMECIVHTMRRDLMAQAKRAEEVIALSEANGFAVWLGAGRINHGQARVLGGESGAIADVFAGMGLLAETGNQGGAPDLIASLAEMYMIGGQLADARGAIETAFAVAAQTGQPGAAPNLHRLQGMIALEEPADAPQRSVEAETTAEEYFRRAVDVARAQGQKLAELRAATSLALLWRGQGKRAEARDLLSPLYGWFTEGFETRDLIEAKALLEELR